MIPGHEVDSGSSSESRSERWIYASMRGMFASIRALHAPRVTIPAPGHRYPDQRQGRPAFTQQVHVNVTAPGPHGPGPGAMVDRPGALPPHLEAKMADWQASIDHVRRLAATTPADVDRLALKAKALEHPLDGWICRNFGHTPTASDPSRCYCGHLLIITTTAKG